MKRLIVMVGFPRSGKTTRALELSREYGAPIVSPDAVRLAVHGMGFYPPAEPLVWGVVKTMVPALFEAGHTHVIVDACNNTRLRRDDWRFKGATWDIQFQVMTTPADICMQRALDGGSEPGVREAIDRMSKTHQPPGPDEGDIVVAGGF